MEHVEWCPSGFREGGLSGQRIAIAGHSHWSDDPDHDGFTDVCLRNVISGEWRISFFTSIARYFGFEDQATFWPQVMFFNFLPTMVGGDLDRFGYGHADQLEAGRARVLRILDQHEPDKLFVFSTKAWREFPPTIEDNAKAEAQPPHHWHTYETSSGHRVKAVGLRHPQGADRAEMTAQVQSLMAA